MILPATGAQGNDGITFQNATYFGTPLTTTVLLDFGTLTNSARDDSTQSVSINYSVVVLNIGDNQTGAALTNLTSYQTGSEALTASAPALSVVVPELDLLKSVSPATGDAGGLRSRSSSP